MSRLPSASTVGSFRTTAFLLAMRMTPKARVTVTTMGRPWGGREGSNSTIEDLTSSSLKKLSYIRICKLVCFLCYLWPVPTSGMAATARLTPTLNMSSTGRPFVGKHLSSNKQTSILSET